MNNETKIIVDAKSSYCAYKGLYDEGLQRCFCDPGYIGSYDYISSPAIDCNMHITSLEYGWLIHATLNLALCLYVIHKLFGLLIVKKISGGEAGGGGGGAVTAESLLMSKKTVVSESTHHHPIEVETEQVPAAPVVVDVKKVAAEITKIALTESRECIEGRTFYITPSSPNTKPLTVKSSPIVYPDQPRVSEPSIPTKSAFRVHSTTKITPSPLLAGASSLDGSQESQLTPIVMNLGDSSGYVSGNLQVLPQLLLNEDRDSHRPRGRSSSTGSAASGGEELLSLNSSADFIHRPRARTLSMNSDSSQAEMVEHSRWGRRSGSVSSVTSVISISSININNEGGIHRNTLNSSGEYRGGVIAALRGVKEDTLVLSVGPSPGAGLPLTAAHDQHVRGTGTASSSREGLSSGVSGVPAISNNANSTAVQAPQLNNMSDSSAAFAMRQLKKTIKKGGGSHTKLGRTQEGDEIQSIRKQRKAFIHSLYYLTIPLVSGGLFFTLDVLKLMRPDFAVIGKDRTTTIVYVVAGFLCATHMTWFTFRVTKGVISTSLHNRSTKSVRAINNAKIVSQVIVALNALSYASLLFALPTASDRGSTRAQSICSLHLIANSVMPLIEVLVLPPLLRKLHYRLVKNETTHLNQNVDSKERLAVKKKITYLSGCVWVFGITHFVFQLMPLFSVATASLSTVWAQVSLSVMTAALLCASAFFKSDSNC